MHKNTLLFIGLSIVACTYTWFKFRPSHSWREVLTPRIIDMDPDGKIARREMLYFQIDSLLRASDCGEAEYKVDSSLSLEDKDIRLLDFKGQALLCRGKAKESIAWFNKAMLVDRVPFPRALGHRAEAYSYLKNFDSAIIDFKECATINNDYTREIASVYEKAGQTDSAIKYYQLFLSYYPDSISVKERLDHIRSSSNQ